MHIGDKEILGQTFEVHTDVSGGMFRIVEPAVEGEEGSRAITLGNSQTLAGAIAEARTELNKRKVTVAIEFKTPKGERAVATTLHGRSGKVMATVNDSRREQFDVHAKVFKSDTPQEIFDKLQDARRRYTEANDEITRLSREWGFVHGNTTSLGNAVREAITQAARETVPA